MPSLASAFTVAAAVTYVLTANGLSVHDARKSQPVAVHLPSWQWAGEPHTCVPKVVIGPLGEAIVTSDVVPQLWRVDPDTLAVTVHTVELDTDRDKDLGFSAIVYAPLQQSYFAVSPMQGSLWRIDRHLRRAQKVPLPKPLAGVCSLAIGPHGLCLRGNDGAWTVLVSPGLRPVAVRAAGCVPPPPLPALRPFLQRSLHP